MVQVTFTLTNGTTVPAIQNEEGIWISSNGNDFDTLVEPTTEWKEVNQVQHEFTPIISEIEIQVAALYREILILKGDL